jgi:[histone H3]-trimethyl-L-lysine4 demethylase
MSIPVQGALPVETPGSTEPSAPEPETAISSSSKRAPRKSKSDALAALSTQTRASSVDPEETEVPSALELKYRNMPPIATSAIFDLNSVKGPRSFDSGPIAKRERLFGLKDCPEFCPTQEEFKDPMVYIQSIAEEAKHFGICKVIPPDGWKMPFVTDSEVRIVLVISADSFINPSS